MPELPEVETVRRTLEPLLCGQEVLRVWRSPLALHRQPPAPRRLQRVLEGLRVTALERRGKYLVLRTPAGGVLVHLGMSGQLTVVPGGEPHRPHTHWVAALGNGLELRLVDPRRFGQLEPFQGQEPAAWHALGPDPTTPAFTLDALCLALRRTRRAVKMALLDQSVVAGLGNIYVAEALFAAGVHPLRAANALTLEELTRLHVAVVTVITDAILRRGTSLNDYVDGLGVPGENQHHLQVYGRQGQACGRCRGTIAMLAMGGRCSCFCPTCQPRRARHSP